MAVLTALTVFAVPAAAQAAPGPEIRWAQSEFDGNVGVLLVGIRSADGVSKVHADVKDWTGKVIASSDSFRRYSGDPEDDDQVWATGEPFILPEMGYYPVDVEVTDENGVTTRETNAGDLAYVIVTFLDSVTVKPATVTYDKRWVTVTGVLKGRRPGTMEVRRVAGASVSLSGSDWIDVMTGADGTFTARVPIEEGDRNIFVNYQGYEYDTHPYNLPSSFLTPVVTITPRATKVTATASARRVKAGESVTVSGAATWNTPDGWAPVSSGRVYLTSCDNSDHCDYLDGAPVAAGGTYSMTVVPHWGMTLRASYIAPHRPDGFPDPFVANSQRDVAIVVLQPSSISDFTATREADGAVHLHGYLLFSGGPMPGPMPIEFQFSETGTGDWLAIGDDDQADYHSGGYEFEARLTEGRSGWWRARYAGHPRGWEAATSKKVFVE